jgi:ATP-dependent helicase/nuclease subunit B
MPPLSSSFTDQLKRLCDAHPTRAKWVIVPAHAIGRTIGDRLAREGGGWANLRFVTPFDLALRMGAPFLVERGVDPSEEGLGPALVMRLLLAQPERDGYFRPLATQPDLAAALWSTIREIRMAGIKAADLPSNAFVSSEKHDELVALLASYEAYLTTTSRGDRATVFEEAVQHLDWCPIRAEDCLLELPDARWQPLEQQLVDALPGERVSVLSGAGRPQGPPLRHREDPSVPSSPGPLVPSSPLFFVAGGADAEIEEIFRRVLVDAAPLDDVEVVAPTPQSAALIWEKAVRFDWPITVAHGLPVALTRPGRALRAFVEWIDDDFAAGRLRRMLQSGDMRIEGLDISPARAARVLVKARAAWGRQTFRLALARYAMTTRRRAERDDMPAEQREGMMTRADEADALRQWIDALVASVPALDEAKTVSVRDLAACAKTFVDTCAGRASALDRLASAALTDALAELQALDDFRCPLGHALQFVGERVSSLTIGADRPRPGHLHVSALSNAGYAGRPVVFVMGLEEGRVFPVPFEDPILLDAERERIGRELRRSHDRTDDAVALGKARLADIRRQPGVRVTYSYSCRDLREYRQTYASWLMLDAFREATNNPSAQYQELHAHLGEPVSCVPPTAAAALDDSRWWLRGVVSAGAAAKPAVLAAYPSLAAGLRAEERRDGTSFTEYDGYVPAAGPVLDPCQPGRVVSPTSLEDAAKCPFRYFLRYGLGVDAIESGERDRDVWLDPLLRGSLLHDLYAELLRRCRADNRRVSIDEDAAWMAARGEQTLVDLAVEMPPPSEEVRARETELLLRDLAIFVEAEAQLDAARTPIGLEVGFGRGGASEIEPLSQEQPIVLDLGGGVTITVAGRIDRIDQIERIDRTGKTTFEIIDYKTGGYWADDWIGVFAGGTRLQHALYGLAAAELLRRTTKSATVSGAQYYFPSEKGQQERKQIAASSRAKLQEVIADLRQVIVSGAFVHASTDSGCKFCHYGPACGRNAIGRAKDKMADTNLDAMRRLMAHE